MRRFWRGSNYILKVQTGHWIHRHDPRYGHAIFLEEEGGALIADPVNAVSKHASRRGHADDPLFHEIRLSDNL